MKEASGKERTEEMITALRRWQKIERKAMDQTAEIMEQTENPFLRLIMEVIRHDSLMHHRVQQVLIDSLTVENVQIQPEEIGRIWNKIEAHDEMEKEVVNLGEELRDQAWSPIHRELLDYLVEDEKKHDRILEHLGEIKKGMYPYGS